VNPLFSNIKNLFLFAYEATEKMEEKAEKFEHERAKRMESFHAERNAARERAQTQIDDMKAEVQGHVREALSAIGVTTKDEVDELKTLLTELSKKVDKLAK
jgi:polyhydroxyalkanoate synthesis regulator phasin